MLIACRRTGICGTDVHIYKWDAWAQKTIPVPMAVGHEFVGEIVRSASNVTDFIPAKLSAAKGTWSAGAAAIASRAGGIFARTRRASASIARRVRRIHRAADDQRLAPRPEDRPRHRLDFRSFRKCRPHRALVSECSGEDVLITGAGPIGFMAAAVVRNTPARVIVVVTDVNPYRLELAQNGRDARVDPRRNSA